MMECLENLKQLLGINRRFLKIILQDLLDRNHGLNIELKQLFLAGNRDFLNDPHESLGQKRVNYKHIFKDLSINNIQLVPKYFTRSSWPRMGFFKYIFLSKISQLRQQFFILRKLSGLNRGVSNYLLTICQKNIDIFLKMFVKDFLET